MTVAAYEIERYPREEGNVFEGGRCVRKLKCAWTSRYDLVNELMETYWPYASGSSLPVAHEYAIEPFPKSRMGGSGSLASYDDALVTIVYDTKVYLFNGYSISEEIVPLEEVNRYGGDVCWSDGSHLRDGEAPTHHEAGFRYIFTYHRLYPYQVSGDWYTYTGYVNGATMVAAVLERTFATDTMLYRGPTLRHSIMPGVMTPTVSASLRFDYMYRGGYGWQGVWRGSKGQYERCYTPAGVQILQYPRGAFMF